MRLAKPTQPLVAPEGRIAKAVLAEYDAGRTRPMTAVAAEIGVEVTAQHLISAEGR